MATKKKTVEKETPTRKRRVLNWDKTDEQLKDFEKKNYTKNDGFSDNLYVPNMKDDGTFQAIIRFLPRPEGDGNGIPFVKLYHHGFKDVQGWFIENCPTTLGDKCPVCSHNSGIWSSDENTARRRGRRTNYFSNILVVTDPQCKENEGKVFILRYGKTIHDMIMEKVSPEAGSVDEKVHVHDYDEGLNFKLKIKPKKVGNTSYNDYSSSQFSDTITPISDDDEVINKIDDSLLPLEPIIDKDKFKEFSVLESRFLNKIGEVSIPKSEDTSTEEDYGESEEESESDGDIEEEISEEEEPEDFFNKLKD